MKFIKMFFFVFVLLFSVIGCSSSNLIIIKPLSESYRVGKISIVKDSLSIDVPMSIEKIFKESLKEFLYQEDFFEKGDDMIIKYKFTRMKKIGLSDSEAWGPIWKSGEPLDIVIIFVDSKGKEINIIKVMTKGSKLEDGAERAAYEIAEYTAHNFLK
ncbi:MAG: hypothetical protein FJW61_03520 [Actinobacteria bacterium]|nr:hypothetical protein [Actinomycetota bacterium]